MRQSLWYSHEIRARYQETDQMGVVYHSNYLNWFEIGRTEWIRGMGMTYRQIEERGLFLPVVELEMKFNQPARYDDRIVIYTRVAECGHVRIRFESQIRRLDDADGQPSHQAAKGPVAEPEGELLVTGQTKHVWVNSSWKPVRLDKEAPDLFRLILQNS